MTKCQNVGRVYGDIRRIYSACYDRRHPDREEKEMGDKFVKLVETNDVVGLVKVGVALACVNITADAVTALATVAATEMAGKKRHHHKHHTRKHDKVMANEAEN